MARPANLTRLLIVMVAVLLISLTCVAQLDTGTIGGIIQDRTGAVLPGATIKITNVKTGRVWTVTSGSMGEYSVPALPVGPYRIEVTKEGFKTGVVSNIFLNTTETARADVKLEVGAASEQLTVTAEQAVVNTTTSDLGATINSKSVTNLPLNGRDFTSLLALVPGSVTTAGFGQTSLGGFETSLAGVNVLLDGTDATRIDVNATSTQLGRQESRISRASVDSIQEFRVLSGVYSAEYGRSTGDIVNVITKSGGNDIHGNVFEFLRNDAMDAKNYFDQPGEKAPLRMNQFGGNVGGPIIRNKLFYFVNYEGVRQVVNVPQTVPVIAEASRSKFVPSMYPVRDAIPHPNRPGPVVYANGDVNPDLAYYHGLLANRLREDTGSLKIDFTPSMSDSFAIRYNIADSFTSTQYGFATDQISPSNSRNHLAKISWTHTFRPNLLNEFGVALNRPQTDSLGGGGDFPIFQCSTFWGCGQTNNFGSAPGPALFSNRRPQHSISFTDTASWVKGRNTIRFGFDIRKNVTHDALDPQKFLSYANINDFFNNAAIQLDTLGHTMVGVENSNIAFFFQDDIRVTTRLTVNLGLRYEYNTVLHGPEIGNFDIANLQLLPKGASLYKPDRNNFAPRVGFSWDPFGNGKTVFRGGAGIFYSPLLTGAALSLAGNYQQSFSVNLFDFFFGLECNPPLNLAYPVPETLPTCNKVIPASVNALDQNMRDTYSGHWSLGIQREITSGTVAEFTYVGNRGIKLPAGAAYAGLELNYSPFGGKQLSDNFGNIRRLGNFLDSNYNALQVSVRRRMSKGITFDANYTWSHELDDAVNILTGAFQNSHDPGADYASGDIDVRHNFTLGLVYDVPQLTALKGFGRGWQISSIFQTRTGLPVNIALAAPFLGIDQLRPNLVPGQNLKPLAYTVPGDPNDVYRRQFNPDAFENPDAGQFGNAPRNYGRGPGYNALDFALQKTTQISERFGVQVRAELFNMLNRPNFSNPVGYLNDSNFGRSTTTIGNHVGTGTSRQAQLALKLVF